MATAAELLREIGAEAVRIDALIADATEHHGTMPDNYWKRLRSLQEQLRARLAIDAVIAEANEDAQS
jgi:hypothetical protein